MNATARNLRSANHPFVWMLAAGCWLVPSGCGYTTQMGLASHIRSVYVKPFANKIDVSQPNNDYQRFPVYRHAMESDLTGAVIDRFQWNGLLRPVNEPQADSRLEGDLVEFRRDALRFSRTQQIEEWRLSVVADVRFVDLHTNTVLWEKKRLTGDTTYLTVGPNAETELEALERAIQDLAQRIVERAVEGW